MITQVANPSSIPSAVADYEAQNAHISAFNNIVNNQPFILTNSGGTGLPAIKLGTYIQYGGNLYVVDTGDYAITGTPVDGNNYIRLSGTTTLTAEWVQDVSSYVWNEVYGYKESGSYFLLPYLVVKDGTEYSKYSFIRQTRVDGDVSVDGSLEVTGAISGASINTGYGDNNVYKSTHEEIDINTGVSTNYNISQMSVGETRMVYIRLVYTGSSGQMHIKTPIDGSIYYTSTTFKSNYSGPGDPGNLSSKLANNTTIVNTNQAGNNDITGMIIIKRIS